jgi:hypothetical protein
MTSARSWLRGHCRLSRSAAGPENSGLLCERHHTQVHSGFTIERDDTGRWHTHRPDGTEIHVIRPPADDPRLARAG